jgi:kinesin family protein 13
MRSYLQRPLDSYQEEDLGRLRERWNEALDRRRQYLDAQIQQYVDRADKTEAEAEREQSLVEQWVHLTEERNAVLAPAENSGVPGAPTSPDRVAAPGLELHHPVLFLDLQPDDFTDSIEEARTCFDDDYCDEEAGSVPLYCHQSILPKEHGGRFYSLPIIRHLEQETAVVAVASWDSSIHESIYLNRLTEPGERAYLIVKAVVRLTHPRLMDLVLRKRICYNVYKQQRSSLTDRIRRRLASVASITAAAVSTSGSGQGSVSSVGVVYDLVAHVPKGSEELEARESLAAMAASSNNVVQDLSALADGETFIEKYSRTASAVDELLRLDKLRQQVAVRELLAQANKEGSGGRCRPPGGRQSMRKTFSVPNFQNTMKSSVSLDSLSSFRSHLRPSESFQDLNGKLVGAGRGRRVPTDGIPFHSEELDAASSRYGNNAAPPLRRLPLSLTMSTLHEERSSRPLEDTSSPEHLNSPQREQQLKTCLPSGGETRDPFFARLSPPVMTKSQTVESLSSLHHHHEQQQPREQQHQLSQPPKNGSPSLLSSGYESQAVSLTTLSSEDSLSVRSMSVEDENQEGESDVGRLSDLTTADVSGRCHPLNRSMNDEERSLAVVRRNNSMRNWNKQQNHRLSCPSSLISMEQQHHHHTTSSRTKLHMDNNTHNNSSAEGINIINNNSEETDQQQQLMLAALPPDWLVVGESVQVRPSNLSGVVRFIGPTRFAPGLWIGVELDTSRGKNDGSVDGIFYFSCAARRGMFVRAKSLKLDRRGREMRALRSAAAAPLDCPAAAAVQVRTGSGALRSSDRTRSRQSLTSKTAENRMG